MTSHHVPSETGSARATLYHFQNGVLDQIFEHAGTEVDFVFEDCD
jgi:hypothetical protein